MFSAMVAKKTLSQHGSKEHFFNRTCNLPGKPSCSNEALFTSSIVTLGQPQWRFRSLFFPAFASREHPEMGACACAKGGNDLTFVGFFTMPNEESDIEPSRLRSTFKASTCSFSTNHIGIWRIKSFLSATYKIFTNLRLRLHERPILWQDTIFVGENKIDQRWPDERQAE